METTITLTEKEVNFINSVMTEIVPGLTMPAKDAAPILELANGIVAKLTKEVTE